MSIVFLPGQAISVTYRFDVAVQEANGVDALYGFQNLPAESEGGGYRERSIPHGPTQVRQILPLKMKQHSHIHRGSSFIHTLTYTVSVWVMCCKTFCIYNTKTHCYFLL